MSERGERTGHRNRCYILTAAAAERSVYEFLK